MCRPPPNLPTSPAIPTLNDVAPVIAVLTRTPTANTSAPFGIDRPVLTVAPERPDCRRSMVRSRVSPPSAPFATMELPEGTKPARSANGAQLVPLNASRVPVSRFQAIQPARGGKRSHAPSVQRATLFVQPVHAPVAAAGTM